MRVPAGRLIMPATSPAPGAAPRRPRAQQSVVALSAAPRESCRREFGVCTHWPIPRPALRSSREPAADSARQSLSALAVPGDKADASRRLGWHSRHGLAPRVPPKRQEAAFLRRSAASPPRCGIAASTLYLSLVWLVARCPRFFVDTIFVSTKAIISEEPHDIQTVQIGRLPSNFNSTRNKTSPPRRRQY